MVCSSGTFIHNKWSKTENYMFCTLQQCEQTYNGAAACIPSLLTKILKCSVSVDDVLKHKSLNQSETFGVFQPFTFLKDNVEMWLPVKGNLSNCGAVD